MKNGFFTLLAFCFLLFSGTRASAKSWRVNNNAGIGADFADFPGAVTGAVAGDTIYLESSATSYNGVTNLSKRLVIIGTGYYLSGTPLNPNTQFNPNSSSLPYLYCVAGSAGTVIEGLTLSSLLLGDNNITVQRNNINTITLGYTGNSNGDTLRQNVITSINAYTTGVTATNLLIYNNIFLSGLNLQTSISNMNGYLINNVIGSTTNGGAILYVANFTLQNNILYSPSFNGNVNSNVYFNNIVSTSSAVSGMPAGNANVFDVTDFTTVFVGWGASSGFSPDGAYALKAGSPAIGAGALNSTTVDCGPFGGPAPYVLSGMPSGIPSIYALTAPTQVNTGTASINITISSASH